MHLAAADPAFAHNSTLLTIRDVQVWWMAALTAPSSSADVADGLRIAGFISLGLRNFYLEKACLQVEHRAKTLHFTLMSNGFPTKYIRRLLSLDKNNL